MKTLKWLVAGIVVGVIAVAFRDLEGRQWLAPAFPGGDTAPDEEEPVLGYDGMDQETLLEWISAANLDSHTLRSMARYEKANFGRQPVLEMIRDLID